MRRLLPVAVFAVLSAGVYLAAGAPAAAPRDQTAALMQAKLKAIHSIAEGLVCKNFDDIEQSGATLASLSAGDDWQHHGDSVYREFRDQLRRNSLKIAELARLRNLEGATYGYMTLISSCVDCHSHCRDVLHIADPMPVLRPVPSSSQVEDGPVFR